MNCTAVSLVPREIREHIPSLHPDTFTLPPAKGGIPSLLTIEPNFYYKPGLEGTTDRIDLPSNHVAEGLVKGYCTSQIGYGPESSPAFFFVVGDVTVPEVLKKHAEKVTEALRKQKNWFLHLVKVADDDWILSHRHGVISDLQRQACRELGFSRDWLIEIPSDNENPSCPACGADLLKPDAAICHNCKSIINPKRAKELKEQGLTVVGA